MLTNIDLYCNVNTFLSFISNIAHLWPFLPHRDDLNSLSASDEQPQKPYPLPTQQLR